MAKGFGKPKPDRHSIDRDVYFDEGIEVVFVQALEASGLRLEEHIRRTEEGVCLTQKAEEAIEASGTPIERFLKTLGSGESAETLEGIGIDRDPFYHPLSETFEGRNGESELLNLWTASAMVINAAQGWVPSEDGGITSRETLQSLLALSAPTADVDRMLYRSRYDDRVLLTLANRIHEGFNLLATRQQ